MADVDEFSLDSDVTITFVIDLRCIGPAICAVCVKIKSKRRNVSQFQFGSSRTRQPGNRSIERGKPAGGNSLYAVG
jgi:hypothetical protein